MKKVLVAGDTHGNTLHWKNVLFPAAKQHGADLIIQAGDFGVWPGRDGQTYLDNLNRLTPVPIWFVRGNHEDSTQLCMGADGNGKSLVPLRENVLQIVDGAMLDIDGHTLLGVGGAVSIDKAYRVLGRSWWDDEVTTMESVERALYSEPRRVIDFVVTHDVPNQLDVVGLMWKAKGQMIKNDLDSAANRAILGVLFQKLQGRKPRDHNLIWLHGHYHFAHSTVVNHTHFIGLDCDDYYQNAQDSWTIIEMGKPDEPSPS